MLALASSSASRVVTLLCNALTMDRSPLVSANASPPNINTRSTSRESIANSRAGPSGPHSIRTGVRAGRSIPGPLGSDARVRIPASASTTQATSPMTSPG